MDVVPVAVVPLPDPGTTGRQPAAPEGFPDLWAVLAELLSAEAGAEPLPPEAVPALAVGGPAPEEASGDPEPQDPGTDAPQSDPGGLALVLAVPTPAPVPDQAGLPSGETAGADAEPARPRLGSQAVDLPSLTETETAAEAEGRAQAPADPRAERLWGFWLPRARGAPPPGETAGAGAEPLRPPLGSQAVDLPSLTETETAVDADGRVQAPADPKAERLWGFWLRRARGTPPAAAGLRGPDGILLQAGEAKAEGRGPAPGPGAASPVAPEARGPQGFAAVSRPAAGTRGEHSRERPPGESDPKPVPAVGGTAGAEPAAPAEPQAAQPNPSRPPQPPPAVDQVSRAVRVAIRTGSDRMTVQLEPEHLGRVQVEVAREAGGLTAHIRVETPQAHQLLVNELPALRAAAETRQVPLVQVAVEFDRGGGRHGGRPDPRPRGRRRAPDPLDDEVTVRSAWMPWGFETRI
ncbi:flagellar hook-length control protein FliK [Deferrisoma sp.]